MAAEMDFTGLSPHQTIVFRRVFEKIYPGVHTEISTLHSFIVVLLEMEKAAPSSDP